MADIKVIKLKIRRGLNSQRKKVVLDQGELGYTIDTQRLFVGTGTLSGGRAVGSKLFAPITNYNDLSALPAEIGDACRAHNKLYQLVSADYFNLSAWAMISPQVDGGYIVYDTDDYITIDDYAVDGSKLYQQGLSSSSIGFNSNQLVVNYNTTQFTLSGTPSKFALNSSGVTQLHIATTALSSGLQGGGGVPLRAKVDNVTIGINGSDELEVISHPVSAVGFTSLVSGFEVNQIANTVSTIVRGVDDTNFTLVNGDVTLNTLGVAGSQELPYITLSDEGLVAAVGSSIFDILSANDSTFSTFNGSPDQVATSYTPSTSGTVVSVISAGNTKTATSAGFVVFEGGTVVRNDGTRTPGMFAIPVYTLS